MSSYQKYKESIKKTNVARRAAIRTLIENHRAEFDNLYLEEAKKFGLNPIKIQAQVKKHPKTEAELQTELWNLVLELEKKEKSLDK